jgi:hypothetical protein
MKLKPSRQTRKNVKFVIASSASQTIKQKQTNRQYAKLESCSASKSRPRS